MKAKNKKILKIVGGVLGAVVAFGAIFSIFKADDEVKLNSTKFEIAAVDKEGKVYESDTAIVTKDLISVNELKIEYKKDAEVEYRVHFYDGDKEYVSSTEWMQKDYEYEAVEGIEVVYAHVEIRPLDDDDGKVGFFEKNGYVNDIEVKYNPELLEFESEDNSAAEE